MDRTDAIQLLEALVAVGMNTRQSAAKLLSKDEARRIASNIVKLPELLNRS